MAIEILVVSTEAANTIRVRRTIFAFLKALILVIIPKIPPIIRRFYPRELNSSPKHLPSSNPEVVIIEVEPIEDHEIEILTETRLALFHP